MDVKYDRLECMSLLYSVNMLGYDTDLIPGYFARLLRSTALTTGRFYRHWCAAGDGRDRATGPDAYIE